VPAIGAVVQGFGRDHPGLDRSDLLRLVEALWARSVHECRMAAVELLDHQSWALEARSDPRTRIASPGPHGAVLGARNPRARRGGSGRGNAGTRTSPLPAAGDAVYWRTSILN